MKPVQVRNAPNGHVEAVYIVNGREVQVQGRTAGEVVRHLQEYLKAGDKNPSPRRPLPAASALEV